MTFDHLAFRRRLTAVIATLGILAAGCGSTVQVGLEGAGPAGGEADSGMVAFEDDGLTMDSADAGDDGTFDTVDDGTAAAGGAGGGAVAAGAAGTSGSGGGGSGGGGSGGAGGAAAGSGGGGSGSRTSSGAGGGRMGPGVTADEIVIGIAIPDDGDTVNNANLGTDNLTQGDTERYYNLMREEINSSGGIAGRKIRYSIYRFSNTNTNSTQMEQAACAHWTQDDRAFTATFSYSPNFLSCAQRNGLSTTFSGLTFSDDRIYATFPTHIEHSAMSLTRQMLNLPKGLVAEKYFDKGYKLGVITYDQPTAARAVDGTLKPALARLGHKITDIRRISYLESTNDVGKLTAEMQNAILSFKTQGITHVIIVDEKGVLTLLATAAAENQNYRPRYGLNSQNGLTVLASQVPPGQFNRAVGIGWFPQLDVPERELPRNPSRERCLATFKKHGQEPANANNAGVMVSICERINFVKASVEAGLPDITAESFARGAESLRGSFPSALGLGNNFFSPKRHAGAAFYRHVRYDPQCTCFHYTSKPIRDR
jgi:hypothetical protein